MEIAVCMPVYRKVALMLMTTWAICGMQSVDAYAWREASASAPTAYGPCSKYTDEYGRNLRMYRCRDGRCVRFSSQCYITTTTAAMTTERSCFINIFRRHRCPDGQCVRQSSECVEYSTTPYPRRSTTTPCWENIYETYTCADGRCVENSYQCNEHSTTPYPQGHCSENVYETYTCADGSCVEYFYQCSEDSTTPYHQRPCSENVYETYTCADGSCVEYFYQCSEYSTTPYPWRPTTTSCWENVYETYTCADGSCAENSYRCYDCEDNLLETYTCSDGRCVEYSHQCYGNPVYIGLAVGGPISFIVILIIVGILTWRCRVRRIAAGLENSSRCVTIVGCGRRVPYAPLQNTQVQTVATVTSPQNQPQILVQRGTASPVSIVPPPPYTAVMAYQEGPLSERLNVYTV